MIWEKTNKQKYILGTLFSAFSTFLGILLFWPGTSPLIFTWVTVFLLMIVPTMLFSTFCFSLAAKGDSNRYRFHDCYLCSSIFFLYGISYSFFREHMLANFPAFEWSSRYAPYFMCFIGNFVPLFTISKLLTRFPKKPLYFAVISLAIVLFDYSVENLSSATKYSWFTAPISVSWNELAVGDMARLEGKFARSINTLERLREEDLKNAKEASETAEKFYRDVGNRTIEEKQL